MFNTYSKEDDLAVIKPHWTDKHEFKINLPPNKQLDDEFEHEEDNGGQIISQSKVDGM